MLTTMRFQIFNTTSRKKMFSQMSQLQHNTWMFETLLRYFNALNAQLFSLLNTKKVTHSLVFVPTASSLCATVQRWCFEVFSGEVGGVSHRHGLAAVQSSNRRLSLCVCRELNKGAAWNRKHTQTKHILHKNTHTVFRWRHNKKMRRFCVPGMRLVAQQAASLQALGRCCRLKIALMKQKTCYFTTHACLCTLTTRRHDFSQIEKPNPIIRHTDQRTEVTLEFGTWQNIWKGSFQSEGMFHPLILEMENSEICWLQELKESSRHAEKWTGLYTRCGFRCKRLLSHMTTASPQWSQSHHVLSWLHPYSSNFIWSFFLLFNLSCFIGLLSPVWPRHPAILFLLMGLPLWTPAHQDSHSAVKPLPPTEIWTERSCSSGWPAQGLPTVTHTMKSFN